MRPATPPSVAVRVAVACVVVLAASSTKAQTRPPVPVAEPSTAGDCGFFVPVIPPSAEPPPGDAPAGEPPDQIAFGSVVIAAPPAGTGPVPRNVELLLAGALTELDQGFWVLRLEGPSGPLSFRRDGARIVPDGGLLPPGVVTVSLAPTETQPCQGCFPPSVLTLEVIDVVDVTPPVFTELVVHEIVPPSLEQQTACNVFVGTADVLQIAVTTDEDAIAAFGARHALVAPRIALQAGLVRGGYRVGLAANIATTPLIAEGDDVIVVAFARDFAGNVSPPVVSRVRARSMLSVPGADATVDELPEQRCALDSAPQVHLPTRVPRNPALRVLFPFEELPLALRRGDELVALVPGNDVVEDARTGRLFSPAQPVEPGAWDLISLPCPRCACPQCTTPLRVPVVIDDVIDGQPPAAPGVRTLIDDADPPRAQGLCTPDHAATLAVLSPGDDDVAGAYDLVYDVVVRLGSDPPRPLGVGLTPLRRADGDVVLRLPTAPFGRIVDEEMTLEVTARDTAGNATTGTWSQGQDDGEAGCAATGSGTALVLAGVVLRRRRWR